LFNPPAMSFTQAHFKPNNDCAIHYLVNLINKLIIISEKIPKRY